MPGGSEGKPSRRGAAPRASSTQSRADRPRRSKITFRLASEGPKKRATFEIGEQLGVEVRGLRPRRVYEVALLGPDGRLLFTDRSIADGSGTLTHSDLWPQMGLDDPNSGRSLTHEDAGQLWNGKRLRLQVRSGRRAVIEKHVRIVEALEKPLLFAADAEERPLNGFEAGSHEAVLSGYNLRLRGTVRVYLVPRNHFWQRSDRFQPVRLAGGRPAFVDAEVDNSGRLRARVAGAAELVPGAYDFIVRRLRYGYEDDEDFRLRESDLVAHRGLTGLVVRHPFLAFKTVRGGCVNSLQIAGRSISGAPYFQYADTFQVGEDVYGALDPAALDPNHQGKMVALYVVPHKSPAQWSVDKSLNHLAVLGGNASVQILKTQVGCVNFNKRLLWPDAAIVGEYDVVADFGNNTPDAAAFDPDDQLTSPLDIVDGYFVAGLRVVPDPTTDTSFPHAGSFSYEESTEGWVDVFDDDGDPWTVPLRAVVYFPSSVPGANSPAQISPAQANYPVVVVAHGNSSYTDSYQGYNYLLEHLALNGFIAASVHLEPGQLATDRARVIFEHLGILKTKFGAKAANSVGLMGHSRGGEAVVIAARLNAQEGLEHDINAVVSLAPTDWIAHESFGGAWATPFLVVYGAMDGDVQGPEETGFALWDRASDERRSMVFVYGATHGRFNTVWGDVDIQFSGDIGPNDIPHIISADAHHKVAKGYMAAFFRQHLKGEAQWEGIFRGEWVPSAVESADPGKLRIYVQYLDTVRRVVDDFEGPHTPTSWQASTIGDAVTDDGTLLAPPVEDDLASIDAHSPHDTAGLRLAWDSTGDRLRFEIPPAQKNVSGFSALSFRVTKVVNSPSNPSGPQNLYATLEDVTGKGRSILVGKFAEIPEPQERDYDQYTKSAMRTVRIPLHAFTIEVLGTERVDLKKVSSLAFDFGAVATGEIEIDNVEFTQ